MTHKARIRDVMSPRPIALNREATLHDAAMAMRDNDIGDVLVLGHTGRLHGIVTDRDLVVRGLSRPEPADALTVEDVCTRDVTTLAPDDEISDAVMLMSRKAIRRIPIVEDGRPVGIVSLGDLALSFDPQSALAAISSATPAR